LLFFPKTYSEKQDLPSPAVDADGREVILVKIKDNLYTWFDATVENGDTFDYKTKKYGKGNQLLADKEDFPAFALHGILKGHDLSGASKELWKVFNEKSDEFFRLNVADILRTSDTTLAYLAYREIYPAVEGYVKQQALLNIVRLRPGESTSWFLDGLQTGDWQTANLAMDSLISTTHFYPGELVDLYKQSGTPEETRWRIVFIMGHRDVPESLPLLVEALRDPGWLVYNEAAVGLSRLPSEKVNPRMKELLADPDFQVRSNARLVIKKLKD